MLSYSEYTWNVQLSKLMSCPAAIITFPGVTAPVSPSMQPIPFFTPYGHTAHAADWSSTKPSPSIGRSHVAYL